MNFIMQTKCRKLRSTRKLSSRSRVGAFDVHQQFIQKSTKRRSKNTIGVCIDVWLMFHWKNLPNSYQKPSQNPSKNYSKNRHHVRSCFDRFWDPKMPPETLQNIFQKPTRKIIEKWFKKNLSQHKTGSALKKLWRQCELGVGQSMRLAAHSFVY